jgi:hypothetical protein
VSAQTTKFHIYWAGRTFFVSEILGTKIKMSDGDIDMVNRDPNGINAHLGVRSFDTYYLFIIIIIVIVNFDDVTLKIPKRALKKYTKFKCFLI